MSRPAGSSPSRHDQSRCFRSPRGGPAVRVAFVTPDVGDNSTGRTYCLWLLAEALGWESVTLAYGASSVWPPLAGSRFAETIRLLPSDRAMAEEMIVTSAEQADVVVAVKPVHDSFGLCLGACSKKRFPLVLDIDDPDLEVVLGNRTPRARRADADHSLTRTMSRALALKRRMSTVPRFVSNPELQRLYGGRSSARQTTFRGIGRRCRREHGVRWSSSEPTGRTRALGSSVPP